jgi:peptidoglycan hydrolase CwlO-like protein
MVWTMWQGWNDEKNERLRVERELKNLTNLFRRVVSERDSLKEECDSLKKERYELEEENKRLRNN